MYTPTPPSSQPPLDVSPQLPPPLRSTPLLSNMQPPITTSPSLTTPTTLNHEPTFICTICWQAQYAPSKPKLLGTSSRIVCRACWKAVLDLSICWVCGECIVRGDEVVSLGWCFWHRACFGCLVCGTRIGLVDREGGGEWGGLGALQGGMAGRRRKRKIGIELESIPLCGVCKVETEGKIEEEVLETGLQTVSRFDGGLSRDRYDMLSKARDDRRLKTPRRRPRRFDGSSGLKRDLEKFVNRSSGSGCMVNENYQTDDVGVHNSLIKATASVGISRDGSFDADDEDEEVLHQGHNMNSVCKEDIYVSILNPTGEAAFKPSKTKPLPKWMSSLPSSVKMELGQRRNDFPPVTCLYSYDLESLGDSAKDTDPAAASEDANSSIFTSDFFSPKALPRVRIAIPQLPESPLSPFRRVSIVQFPAEPTRKHVFGDIGNETDALRATKDSDTSKPVKCSPPPKRQCTPYPGARVRSKTMEATECKNSMFCTEETAVYSADPGKEHSCDHGVQPNEYVVKRRSTVKKATLPAEPAALSSKCTEKRDCKLAGSDHQKHQAKIAEPIFEKIKRQRIGKLNMAQIAEGKRNESSRVMKIQGEEYGLNPIREDLQRELRNLFNEE